MKTHIKIEEINGKMRRKDKEINDLMTIQTIIKESAVCRLAMTDGEKPYLIPLCFGFQDNTLFFHSARKGLKLDMLEKNPNVCFEFDAVQEVIGSDEPCSWSMKYQSVVGFGKAAFIEEMEEKQKALGIITSQYSDKQFQYPENKVNGTAVFKVEIDSMTGKQSGF
jgi:nitroimidazol reductase NimA-like FMN-containing flavoprotein (pyridoxamine 5'-phosphate oxidase superfamily)